MCDGQGAQVNNRGNHMGNEVQTTISHFRRALGGVDPAALTGADCRALLNLIQASIRARGLE
jgi:hypothetical protein